MGESYYGPTPLGWNALWPEWAHPGNGDKPSLAFRRHSFGANLLMLDGHAERLLGSYLYSNSLYGGSNFNIYRYILLWD